MQSRPSTTVAIQSIVAVMRCALDKPSRFLAHWASAFLNPAPSPGYNSGMNTKRHEPRRSWMRRLAILALPAILWAYWAYETIRMLANPQSFKAEEWVFVRCWAVAAAIATALGLLVLLRRPPLV